jgi:hypothetical protein
MSATILSITINYLALFIEVFKIKCDLDNYKVTNAITPLDLLQSTSYSATTWPVRLCLCEMYVISLVTDIT